jgi:hypothetical protein
MHGMKMEEVVIVMSIDEAKALLNVVAYDDTIPTVLKECGEDYDEVCDLLTNVGDAIREGMKS